MKKKKLNGKQTIEFLKTGNFTIIYWDSDECEIYEGNKWDINKESNRDEYETMNKSRVEIVDIWGEGYAERMVILLAKALGGKVDSI